MNKRAGEKKIREGVVVSDKMDKTVTVLIERRVKHPFYGKIISKKKKLLAHDEQNLGKVGDRVRIMETRPMSRRKNWRVMEILNKETQNKEIQNKDLTQEKQEEKQEGVPA